MGLPLMVLPEKWFRKQGLNKMRPPSTKALSENTVLLDWKFTPYMLFFETILLPDTTPLFVLRLIPQYFVSK